MLVSSANLSIILSTTVSDFTKTFFIVAPTKKHLCHALEVDLLPLMTDNKTLQSPVHKVCVVCLSYFACTECCLSAECLLRTCKSIEQKNNRS